MIDPAMTSPGLSTDEPKSRAFLSVQEAFIPNIKVFGAGGAGGNVVTKMVDVGIRQVEMVICNTDLKALQRNKADHKIELGKDMTRGLGAGARPEVGTNAAEETASEIEQALAGAHMVFIAAGMGGGTGTGAAPVVARIAKARQILTVGVVTLPFSFEGKRRMQVALEGVEELRQHTDTLLVIPNDKLQDASTQTTSLLEAFHMVDSVLINAIQGITDLLNGVGDINVDFADVQTIMENMGRAVIGRGTASGQDRLERAVHNAMHSSLMGN
jgi:cell division protein FtsZ